MQEAQRKRERERVSERPEARGICGCAVFVCVIVERVQESEGALLGGIPVGVVQRRRSVGVPVVAIWWSPVC